MQAEEVAVDVVPLPPSLFCLAYLSLENCSRFNVCIRLIRRRGDFLTPDVAYGDDGKSKSLEL